MIFHGFEPEIFYNNQCFTARVEENKSFLCLAAFNAMPYNNVIIEDTYKYAPALFSVQYCTQHAAACRPIHIRFFFLMGRTPPRHGPAAALLKFIVPLPIGNSTRVNYGTCVPHALYACIS